jgi:O-antigen ligase
MVKMLVLFIALCQELNTPRRLVHWCSALTSGLFVNAVVGLIQARYRLTLGLADLGEPSANVTKTLAATSLKGIEVWRPGAFLVHPNIFGIFLAVLIPLTIAGFLLRSGRVMRIWFMISSLLGMAALIATESRSAWISFCAALTLFLGLTLCHRKLRQRSTAATLAVIVLVIGVIAVEHTVILRRIMDSQAEALEFRGIFNDDARKMIADKPLWGFGLNSYVLNVPLYSKYQYGSWPPPVHNIYYMWWAETGLIGLLVQLSMWGLLIWKSIGNLRVRDETMFAINAACLAGMLAFILDGFVSFSLRITPTLKVFWALSAMIMAIHYWRYRWEVPQRKSVRYALPAPAFRDVLPLAAAPLQS